MLKKHGTFLLKLFNPVLFICKISAQQFIKRLLNYPGCKVLLAFMQSTDSFSINVQLYLLNHKIAFLSTLWGHQFAGKLVVDFIQAIIEHFSLALMAESLRGNIRRNPPFSKEMGHFAKYQVEGLRLPPISIHRQIGEWFYYNFAAESFHTKKLCSRLYSTELEFYSQKRQTRLLSHPLGELGVTYALHYSSLESTWSTSYSR